MDFLGLFGKSKKAQAHAQAIETSKTTSVIINLKEQVALMEKRNEVILTRIQLATVEAKKRLDKKDKNGALISLRKKKQYEAEIEKNQGIQIVLENQIYSLEGATMQKAIVDALALGNKSIKKLNTELNPEKIEELMDDIQEESDNFKVIQEAMAQPLQQIYNDTDLLEELEQLESDSLDKELQSIEFPKVPTKTMPKITEDEEMELELNQLKANMNAEQI